jgi:hypothetical protein
VKKLHGEVGYLRPTCVALYDYYAVWMPQECLQGPGRWVPSEACYCCWLDDVQLPS